VAYRNVKHARLGSVIVDVGVNRLHEQPFAGHGCVRITDATPAGCRASPFQPLLRLRRHREPFAGKDGDVCVASVLQELLIGPTTLERGRSGSPTRLSPRAAQTCVDQHAAIEAAVKVTSVYARSHILEVDEVGVEHDHFGASA